jgi:hypothetical protein
MAGYIFALTTGTGEVKYIFYEIALALTKAREYKLILVRHRVDDEGAVRSMTIFDPLTPYLKQPYEN